MEIRQAVCCALLIAFAAPGFAATAPKPQSTAKPEAKREARPEAKPAKKAEAKTAAPKPLRGKKETLACRLGTEDRHARIAVVLIGGKTDSFAYYSKWKPRTCSIYLQRSRDMYSTWADAGAITTVNLERGAFLIEHKKNEYHFIFRDIDRERYCGMEGVINGSLTIKKGSEQCQLDGEIMVEGIPLGEAVAAGDKTPSGVVATSAPASAAQAAAVAPTGPQPASIADPGSASPSAAPAAPALTAPAATAEAAATGEKAATASIAPPAATTAAEPASAAGSKQAEAAAPATEGAAKDAAKTAANKPEDEDNKGGNPVSAFFKALVAPRNADGSLKATGQSE